MEIKKNKKSIPLKDVYEMVKKLNSLAHSMSFNYSSDNIRSFETGAEYQKDYIILMNKINVGISNHTIDLVPLVKQLLEETENHYNYWKK